MNNLISNLKKPASLSALKYATAVFILVSILSYVLMYIIFNAFLPDPILTEQSNSMDNASDEVMSELITFLAIMVLAGLTTFIASIASMVVVYKKTYTRLRKLALKPKEYARLVTLIFGIAGLIVWTLSYAAQYAIPFTHSEELSQTSAMGYVIEFAGYVISAFIILAIVYFATKRRASKEKEELFS